MRSYPVDWYHQVPNPVKEIIDRLQQAGKKAWIVGGAVRDLFLGQPPKDFDIVSDASPEEIEALFPKTLSVGKQFGIMMVVTETGPVEVAQFRSDAEYKDGRHPEAVSLNVDPFQDAARRDFTMNALFFDPVTNMVIDYVGGVEDIQKRVIRCVGQATKRFEEDALRMLRAIRFFAQLEPAAFSIEEMTLKGVKTCADRLSKVSRERITQETGKILDSPDPEHAMEILNSTGLWQKIFTLPYPGRDAVLEFKLARSLYRQHDSAIFLFPLFLHIVSKHTGIEASPDDFVLSNPEKAALSAIPKSMADIRRVERGTLADKKLALTDKHFLLAWAVLAAEESCPDWIKALASERSAWAAQGVLSPPPLLNGEDIKSLGISEGPRIKTMLQAVRRKQLEEKIFTKEEALALAKSLMLTS